jgi:hypothetical protein
MNFSLGTEKEVKNWNVSKKNFKTFQVFHQLFGEKLV